jgi:hypothetical protein
MEIKGIEQKIVGKLINRIKSNCSEAHDEYVYIRAIKDLLEMLNRPERPVTEDWQVSTCPTCEEGFYDYEECDDGYYTRAYSLDRCPFCGQKLKWYD